MSSVPPGRSIFGLDSNLAGMLTYAPCSVGLVFSILVVVLEKRSRVLRFHAFQSLLIYGVAFAVSVVMQIIAMILGEIAGVLGFLGTMVWGMLLLAITAILILLMLKTYNGEQIELPFVGEMAKRWV